MELKKRLNFGSLMRKRSSHTAQDVNIDPNADTPEANATRGVVGYTASSHLRSS
jgi:hypothetical protein